MYFANTSEVVAIIYLILNARFLIMILQLKPMDTYLIAIGRKSMSGDFRIKPKVPPSFIRGLIGFP